MMNMNELSLFTGSGGGVLATSHLLNWRAVGYVEFNPYCQQVLAQRIKDGVLDNAPIFGDIRSFINEGYADAYQGMVAVISAGFPCQPFSLAGKQQAEDDHRNMWPSTIDVIRRVRPRYCLFENVPGLLSRKHRYFEPILKDLAESGYHAKWKVISAAEVGAPHKRDRLFIVANKLVADTDSQWESQSKGSKQDKWRRISNSSSDVSNSGCKGLERREPSIGKSETYTTVSSTRWWKTEPSVGRVAHGVASRMDRLKAIGNGQVPEVVATAWEILK